VRRGGFTLVEVLVTLTVTSLVATLAWATLGAGYDAGNRVRSAHDGLAAQVAARSLVTTALRLAEGGTPGGDAVFVLSRMPDGVAQRLQVRSRGVAEPFGASATWTVTLDAGPAGLEFLATPLEPGAPPVRAELPSAEGASIVVAAAGTPDTWLDDWPRTDLAPAVVAVRLGSGRMTRQAPIVARLAREGGR
jgi:prepilin-type N-terminal cleavage/methylation domain-containing protein